jgi:hypothetical protein
MEPSSGLAVLYDDSGSSTAIPASQNERWLGLWVAPTLAALEARIWTKVQNIEYCMGFRPNKARHWTREEGLSEVLQGCRGVVMRPEAVFPTTANQGLV